MTGVPLTGRAVAASPSSPAVSPVPASIPDVILTARLAPQSYGIACAQTTFGGPRGIWLECKSCARSEVIVGSRYADDPLGSITDEQAASIFRRHGWTGDGERMTNQHCPKCSATQTQGDKN